MSYLAALCEGMEFATGVLVSPQRQTALLAKQAAQLDLMTGGRLRLCMGVGWNPVEYEALGANFAKRGAIMEEQLHAMRALWTQETVSIDTEFHHIVGVGLAPNAIQQPIPLWLGGWSRRVLDRVGRLGDGWYLPHDLTPAVGEGFDVVREAAQKAGRDPSTLGLQGSIELRSGLDELSERADRWRAAGGTHVAVGTAQAGLGPREHVEVLEQVAERLELERR
jgi:probable F420-dependent oxidoreductase